MLSWYTACVCLMGEKRRHCSRVEKKTTASDEYFIMMCHFFFFILYIVSLWLTRGPLSAKATFLQGEQ